MTKEDKIKKLRELKPEATDYSDRGTSEIFAELFKDEIVYNTTAKEWFYFNGKFWEADSSAMHICTLAKDFYDLMTSYAEEIVSDAERKTYLSYYKRLGSKTKRDILIKDAASNCYISASDFDKKRQIIQLSEWHVKLADI